MFTYSCLTLTNCFLFKMLLIKFGMQTHTYPQFYLSRMGFGKKKQSIDDSDLFCDLSHFRIDKKNYDVNEEAWEILNSSRSWHCLQILLPVSETARWWLCSWPRSRSWWQRQQQWPRNHRLFLAATWKAAVIIRAVQITLFLGSHCCKTETTKPPETGISGLWKVVAVDYSCMFTYFVCLFVYWGMMSL